MKSYKEFFIERAFSSIGQAAREKMRAQAGVNAARNAADRQQQAAKVGVTPPSKQKALAPAKSSPKSPADVGALMLKKKSEKGGTLAKPTADKGSSLAVRPKPGTDGPGAQPDRKPNKYQERPRTLTEPTGGDLSNRGKKDKVNKDRTNKFRKQAVRGTKKVLGRTFQNLMKQSGSNEGGNLGVETLDSPTNSIS